MLKYLVLLLLVLPPWLASELEAPKWVLLTSIAPFLLYAATLGDPDEHLLGKASGKFRKGALLVLAAGGVVLGTAFYLLWLALVPGT